jgi:xanthine dehydrogenase accessory factor
MTAVGGSSMARRARRPPAQIGDRVAENEVVGTIGSVALPAPLAGIIRGLTRSGVRVTARAKVIEVDPRGKSIAAFGLGERPRRIAEGVLRALGRGPTLAF